MRLTDLKFFILLLFQALLASAVAESTNTTPLRSAFTDPPTETRPDCYWYWINDNVSKVGINKDQDAMARGDIGFFNSPGWSQFQRAPRFNRADCSARCNSSRPNDWRMILYSHHKITDMNNNLTLTKRQFTLSLVPVTLCAGWLTLADCAAQNGAATQTNTPSLAAKTGAEALYTQTGSDPTFADLIAKKAFPIGSNSTAGVTGSKIKVNAALLKQSVTNSHPIPEDISIHTLCNSTIPRKDFPKWTRWYQEDGDTQIFRLFEGEHNVRNSRPDAGRVEAFSQLNWKRGDWHEWEGTYTIIKPHGCAIFQVKNNQNDWAVMINMENNGDVILNHRRHQEDKVIARNMAGKSFLLKVRDNGHNYEVYFNGELVGTGYYDRPAGTTGFRWGMYGHTFKHEAMIFVTGAHFK